jgi:hypothetical protein
VLSLSSSAITTLSIEPRWAPVNPDPLADLSSLGCREVSISVAQAWILAHQ